jgi:hypothetical protein
MESVKERMDRIGAYVKIASFMQKEKQDFAFKRKYAQIRAEEFKSECDKRGLNCHVSVGGLDSIILYIFLKKVCNIDVPGISASYLEDKSIQKVHRAIGIINVPPLKREDGTYWSKPKVIQEFGFPVISKEVAAKIELLQNPSEKNKTVRHAIITGETGEYGGWQKDSRMKLNHRWLKLFGGYENENEGCDYQKPDFLVSSKCCYYLKEKNCDDWGKEHNSVPYLGLMASEGGRRAKSLRMNGCNYFGASTIRSAPFAIFHRQDILSLALEMGEQWRNGWKDEFHEQLLREGKLTENFVMPDSLIPEIYGTIEKKPDGTLYTTKAQRTGCSMCGFGIHMEKRPHRFDLLYESNPKEWDYLMFHMCKDAAGNDYGWAKVLEYIGVGWDPTTIGGNCKGQMSLDDFLKE